MSVEYHATCTCGYKSRRLTGDTCVCETCREIVDVPRLPFRYALSPCPLCRSDVSEDQTLLNLLGEGYLVAERPSALRCPKCQASCVTFHLDATVSLAYGVDFPKAGDEIEGYMKKNGQLDIPWFTLNAAEVVHDIPDHIGKQEKARLIVKEIATSKPTDDVMSLFYRSVVTKLTLAFVDVVR